MKEETPASRTLQMLLDQLAEESNRCLNAALDAAAKDAGYGQNANFDLQRRVWVIPSQKPEPDEEDFPPKADAEAVPAANGHGVAEQAEA